MITNDNKSAESAESAEFVTEKQPKCDLFRDKPPIFTCCCGHAYKFNSGLSRHKLKCSQFLHKEASNNTDKELILSLIKENSELKTMMLDTQAKVLGVLENGTHNTNCNNKTFNLQFFLNETCKDALNISDFVKSIKPSLEDLEATGRLGYVEGVSNIILKNLNTLDSNMRPIHCTDIKREVLYVKDNDEWIKEQDEKPVLTKAIKVIANENIKNINEWRKEHPGCTAADSRKNDLYLKIVSNAMSGATVDETYKNINKIIGNVSKKVQIDR